MNIEQIRSLAQIVRENSLTSLDLSEGDVHIRIEAHAETKPVACARPAAGLPAAALETDTGVDFSAVTEVKSPLVGVFYEAPAPDAPPFVKIGDHVKKGDVLCIVEAMKLMNEITAPVDGEIADICPVSGDVVEYGQTLVKLY